MDGRSRRAPRRRHRLGVLLVLLAACGGDDDGDAGNGESAPSTSTSTAATGRGEEPTSGTLELTPSSTTTTTPEDGAVSELLLEEPPLEGFAPADDVLGAGPLDLEAAAAAEADAVAERALLETRGVERGASRAWLDADQDVVYLAVYEFEEAAGAAAYLGDGAQTLEARGATAFDVPEVEGAVGFTTVEEGPEGTFTAHAVAFTRGERWFLVLVGSPGSRHTPDDARAVAAAQAARTA